MKMIELAPDYSSPVLMDPDKRAPYSIDDLPISNGLKKAITTWDEQFQETIYTLESDYSGFTSMRDLQEFNRVGRELKDRLKNELGSGYLVSYFEIRES